jgi:hypothetical protein
MSTTDVADRFVTLRSGMVVPAPAFCLLLDLERRDVHVRREGDSGLVVGPSCRLTDEDRVAIRRWKTHLLMLVNYCQRPDLDAHLFSDTRRQESGERAAGPSSST